MDFVCIKCDKTFTRKDHYDKHVNRKYSCDEDSSTCKFCNKNFSSRSSCFRHKRNCKNKLDNNTSGDITNIGNGTIINDNSKTINNDNSTNNNLKVDGDVKLVKFGNENLSYISDDIFKSILGRGFKCVEELVDHSHFHPDHPENHNIYIANIRNDYVVIYDGKKWNINRKEDIFEDIIYAKSDFLCMKFKELMGQMTETDIKKFRNFIDQRDEDQTMNKIKGELKLQLYNNRYLPQKLRKAIEDTEREKCKHDKKYKRSSKKKLDEVMNMLEDLDDSKLDKMKQILSQL